MPNLEHLALIIAEILTFKQTDTHAENTQSSASDSEQEYKDFMGSLLLHSWCYIH